MDSIYNIIDRLAWLQLWYRRFPLEGVVGIWYAFRYACVTHAHVVLKWLIHRSDGKSHLQRLLENNSSASIRNAQCQLSVSQTLAGPMSDICREEVTGTVRSIASIKKLPSSTSPLDALFYAVAVNRAARMASRKLLDQVGEATSWSDSDCELECVQIYNAVFKKKTPAPAPSPKSKAGFDWVSLGFQGTDPCTDFRGTGKLGLHCFSYICCFEPDTVRAMLIESRSFVEGNDAVNPLEPQYPVALISIHLTSFLMEFLDDEYFLAVLAASLVRDSRDDVPYLLSKATNRLLQVHTNMVKDFHSAWTRSVLSGETTSILTVDPLLDKFKANQRANVDHFFD